MGKKQSKKSSKLKLKIIFFRENGDQGVKSAVKQWKQNMRLLSCKSDSIYCMMTYSVFFPFIFKFVDLMEVENKKAQTCRTKQNPGLRILLS